MATHPKQTQMEVENKMEKVCDVIDDKKSELNKRGREVAEEAKEVVESAKMIIENKRLAERIQKLIAEAKSAIDKMYEEGKEVTKEVKEQVEKDEKIPSKEELKKEALNSLYATQNLLLELIRSERFRDTATDLLDVLYDIMVHGGPKGKQRHQSRYHGKRRKLEHRAEQQFPSYHGEEGKAGTELEKKAAKKGGKAEAAGKKVSELGEKAAQKGEKMGGKAEAAGKKASEIGSKMEEFGKDVDKMGVKEAAVKHGAFTQEQADALEERLNAIMREISNRPRTREATRSLLNLINLLRRGIDHIQCEDVDIRKKGKRAVERMTDNEQMDKVAKICREIIESFTGRDSLHTLYDHLDAVWDMAVHDPKIHDLFRDLYNYLKRSLEDPSSLADDSNHRKEGKELINRFGNMDSLGESGERYREHLRIVFSEADNLIWRIREDSDIQRFTKAIDVLAKDLVLDETGHMKIDTEGVKQLGKLILDIMNEELKYIPLPRIEVDLSEDTHLEAENAVINVPELLPNQITVEAKASAEFGSTKTQTMVERVKEKVTGKEEPEGLVRSEVDIAIKEMDIHVRNMEFHYTRTSFPRLDETGVAKIDVAGKGMSVYLKLSTNTSDDDIFKVDNLETDIDKMRIKVSGTSMDPLYNVLLRVFPGLIKEDLQKKVESLLEDLLIDLNHAIRDNIPTKKEIKKTIERAAEETKSAASKLKPAVEETKDKIKESTKPVTTAPER